MSQATSTTFFIAVPAAVAGAASFGLASAVQQRATKQVPTTGTLDPRLLLELVRRPVWVLGIGTVIVGLSLQLVALAFGPLVLVQPLLVTGVLFGAVFSAVLAHRRVDGLIVLGSLGAVAGLSAFLVLARPTGGSTQLEQDGWALLPLALALGITVLVCLVAASRYDGPVQVAALAAATGVLYGLTAGLMKVVTSQFRSGGPAEVFTHPVLYVVCAVGPMGFLLSQNTFQHGTLIAPALAIITIVDPLVGVAIGVSWLGEEVSSSPVVLAGELIAVLVIIGSVALLAHRGTQLRRELERAPQRGAPTAWG
ncbi:MAG TPA: DMT family transporter [Pseudonocardiaceae bacterium]|nr:DMT family transporter [Pseudonocardiaceae bacterium]